MLIWELSRSWLWYWFLDLINNTLPMNTTSFKFDNMNTKSPSFNSEFGLLFKIVKLKNLWLPSDIHFDGSTSINKACPTSQLMIESKVSPWLLPRAFELEWLSMDQSFFQQGQQSSLPITISCTLPLGSILCTIPLAILQISMLSTSHNLWFGKDPLHWIIKTTTQIINIKYKWCNCIDPI